MNAGTVRVSVDQQVDLVFLDSTANCILVHIHYDIVLALIGVCTELAGLLSHLQALLYRQAENITLPGRVTDLAAETLVVLVVAAQ